MTCFTLYSTYFNIHGDSIVVYFTGVIYGDYFQYFHCNLMIRTSYPLSRHTYFSTMATLAVLISICKILIFYQKVQLLKS